jgi:hypothetical protein
VAEPAKVPQSDARRDSERRRGPLKGRLCGPQRSPHAARRSDPVPRSTDHGDGHIAYGGGVRGFRYELWVPAERADQVEREVVWPIFEGEAGPVLARTCLQQTTAPSMRRSTWTSTSPASSGGACAAELTHRSPTSRDGSVSRQLVAQVHWTPRWPPLPPPQRKRNAPALDQLLSYSTWRDAELALVVFVGRKDMTQVVRRTRTTLEAHTSFRDWEQSDRDDGFAPPYGT